MFRTMKDIVRLSFLDGAQEKVAFSCNYSYVVKNILLEEPEDFEDFAYRRLSQPKYGCDILLVKIPESYKATDPIYTKLCAKSLWVDGTKVIVFAIPASFEVMTINDVMLIYFKIFAAIAQIVNKPVSPFEQSIVIGMIYRQLMEMIDIGFGLEAFGAKDLAIALPVDIILNNSFDLKMYGQETYDTVSEAFMIKNKHNQPFLMEADKNNKEPDYTKMIHILFDIDKCAELVRGYTIDKLESGLINKLMTEIILEASDRFVKEHKSKE